MTKWFKPSPDLAYNCCLYAWWENAFTNDEIAAICDMGERQQPNPAYIGTDSGEINQNIRDSLILHEAGRIEETASKLEKVG